MEVDLQRSVVNKCNDGLLLVLHWSANRHRRVAPMCVPDHDLVLLLTSLIRLVDVFIGKDIKSHICCGTPNVERATGRIAEIQVPRCRDVHVSEILEL